MILSTLGRKVFDQVNLDQTINNAWWVECRLQKMQINGLVKMIQSSRKKTIDYIDGYISKFKWSFRKDSIDILDCEELFYILQNLNEDFPWGMWSDLILIDDIFLLMECINIAKTRNKNNLSYIMAIYRGKKQEINNHTELINNAYIKSAQKIDMSDNTTSDSVIQTWNNLKGLI